jgi:hypothetical protein
MARYPFPLAGEGGGRTPPDEGCRAQRDGFAKLRSIRHCIADPRHSQFRRRNHKFVQQPENPKALISQPDVTNFVGKPLLQDIMTWPVTFDKSIEADPPHPSLLRNDTFPRKGGRMEPFHVGDLSDFEMELTLCECRSPQGGDAAERSPRNLKSRRL